MNNVCVHMHIYMGFLLWVDCVLQWIPVYILRTISFQEITIFLLSFSRHENCFKKTSSRNKIMKGMMMREYFHTCWFVHTHLHLNTKMNWLAYIQLPINSSNSIGRWIFYKVWHIPSYRAIRYMDIEMRQAQ